MLALDSARAVFFSEHSDFFGERADLLLERDRIFRKDNFYRLPFSPMKNWSWPLKSICSAQLCRVC